MKGNGHMTNFTGMGKFTMTTLWDWMGVSTIQTSICWMTTGSSTKGCWRMTQKKGGAEFS